MLTQPMLDKLAALRLRGMIEAFQQQAGDPQSHRLSFEERLGLMVDRQWNWKQNCALERRLRTARLQGNASTFVRHAVWNGKKYVHWQQSLPGFVIISIYSSPVRPEPVRVIWHVPSRRKLVAMATPLGSSKRLNCFAS